MAKFPRWLLASFLLVALVATVLFANLLQVLSLLLRPFSPALFRHTNRLICNAWFGFLRWSLEDALGIEIRQTGDKLPWRENAFLIANHQAMADIPVLIALAHRSGRKGDLKWFVKDPLKWMPGIGWGLQFLDCPFVKRNWTADKAKVLATFSRLRDHRSPFWVISFLEGTRASPAKILRSQEYARKTGLPVLEHVLLPRTKGFEATLEGLGELNQAVYDATIAYEGSAPNLLQLFFGPVERIHLHTRRYTQWPEENRAAWVVERFREKDDLLKYFHEHGKFPR